MTPLLEKELDELPDEQLLLEYRQYQDDDSFNELHRRLLRKIYNLLREITDGEVEDLVQETFLKVIEHLDTYKPGGTGSVVAWVRQIAYSVARKDHRFRKRIRRCPAGNMVSLDELLEKNGEDEDVSFVVDCLPDKISSNLEQSTALQKYVALLPQKQRLAIESVYFEGLTFGEAARKLDVPIGRLKNRVGKALNNLRQWMTYECFNPT